VLHLIILFEKLRSGGGFSKIDICEEVGAEHRVVRLWLVRLSWGEKRSQHCVDARCLWVDRIGHAKDADHVVFEARLNWVVKSQLLRFAVLFKVVDADEFALQLRGALTVGVFAITHISVVSPSLSRTPS